MTECPVEYYQNVFIAKDLTTPSHQNKDVVTAIVVSGLIV